MYRLTDGADWTRVWCGGARVAGEGEHGPEGVHVGQALSGYSCTAQ